MTTDRIDFVRVISEAIDRIWARLRPKLRDDGDATKLEHQLADLRHVVRGHPRTQLLEAEQRAARARDTHLPTGDCHGQRQLAVLSSKTM